MNEIKTQAQGLSQRSSAVMKLIGNAIAERPAEVRKLLSRHNIIVRNGNEAQTLTDAILYALSRNKKDFQQALSDLLSYGEEDQFVGAIAGAVGQVAGVIGSGQQNKAMKEQARSQTLSSILAYKAAQDQNRTEQLRINREQKTKPQSKSQSETKTWLIIGGAVVALVIIALVFQQINKQTPVRTQPVTRTH